MSETRVWDPGPVPTAEEVEAQASKLAIVRDDAAETQTRLMVDQGGRAIRRQKPALPALPDFETLVSMGDQMVRSGVLPKWISNGFAAALVIMTGHELGMTATRALRSLRMVEGNVQEAADSQLARFVSDGGQCKWLQDDALGAVLWLRHPYGHEHTETWTIADSQRAGLLAPKGQYNTPSNHTKYPKQMCRARCVTGGLKAIGWEGGCGIYDPSEELTSAPAPEKLPPNRQEWDPPPAPVVETVHDALQVLVPGPFDEKRNPYGGLALEAVPLRYLRNVLAPHLTQRLTQQVEKKGDGGAEPWLVVQEKAARMVLQHLELQAAAKALPAGDVAL